MILRLDLSLLSPGNRVLVALSGGTDSLALLHALRAGREALGIEIAAGHLHHGMRGSEADDDVAFLRQLCGEWDVPLVVERADVPALAAARRISVEEAGRDARYAAFARMAALHRCGKVATAHTADDQAETILFRLLRGTGIDGLAGIPDRRPLSDDPNVPEVIRPLLSVWRREIEAYCRAHDLTPREDRTNFDLRYQRSRIRHELIPLLEQYSPSFRENLVRLARQAREESALLNALAEALLDERQGSLPRLPGSVADLGPAADPASHARSPGSAGPQSSSPRAASTPRLPAESQLTREARGESGASARRSRDSGTIRAAELSRERPDASRSEAARDRATLLELAAEPLADAAPALARRALRQAVERAAGRGVELTTALLDRLLDLAAGRGPAVLDLPGAPVRVRRAGGRVVFERTSSAPAGIPESVEVALAGTTPAPAFGLSVTVAQAPPPPDPRTPPRRAILDLDRIHAPLQLRPPRRGDRFHPLGAPGSRLLSDLFTDRKVPRHERARWPVLVDQEGIVWVVGLAIAERLRVTAATRECLAVTAEALVTPPGRSRG
jgi:tRNA(Ile)-lysidine synthetase-like protein